MSASGNATNKEQAIAILGKALSTADYEKAKSDLDNLLAVDKDNIDVLWAKSNLLYLYATHMKSEDRGQSSATIDNLFEESKVINEKILLLDTNNILAIGDLGDFYFDKGVYARALEYYDKAIAEIERKDIFEEYKDEYEAIMINRIEIFEKFKRKKSLLNCIMISLELFPDSGAIKKYAQKYKLANHNK